MQLLANELSLHSQFHTVSDFHAAMGGLMAMRRVASNFDVEVECHRSFSERTPIKGVPFQKALFRFPLGERRIIANWLLQTGPYWENGHRHGEDDYFEFDGEIVTDCSVAEAAFRTLLGVECGLLSITPSDWCMSPTEVRWTYGNTKADHEIVEVFNCWSVEMLEEYLNQRSTSISSWNELGVFCRTHFVNLVFSEDCFSQMGRLPFAKCAANRLRHLFSILDDLVSERDQFGSRTRLGHELFRNNFTGDRALFSDSSDTEKRQFECDLTFKHPTNPSKTLFCTWHGKVRHQELRLHFAWPTEPDGPAYVVYVGPKITKR